jgi:4-amino-4-deoxy-L-arabinose transferase-like glycosyltransferase
LLWLALVVVLFCLPLANDLGRADLENDEAIYAFAVDTMVRTGDWLTPKSIPDENSPFLEKPPLKFWIVAAPIRLGLVPHNQFGLRIWDVVFGSVAFLYVFGIGRRLDGPLAGFISVLMLFVHQPLLFVHGLRSHSMEAAVVLSYCGGVFHFLAWRASETATRRRLHILAVVLWFVLGFMTKFVAALFLPLTLGLMAMTTRDDRARLRRDLWVWLVAGAFGAALVAPWFVIQYSLRGHELWKVMFQEHVVTRFTAALNPTHVHPWSYYVLEMSRQLRESGTFSVTIAGLLLLGLAAVRDGRREAGVVLAWFIVPVALISMLSSKLYHYAYPFVPPLAIAAGYAVMVLSRWAWIASAAPLSRLLGSGDAAEPRRRAAAAVVAVAVAVALLPLGAYRATIARTTEGAYPIQAVRDCLRPIAAREAGGSGPGPGVWAEGAIFSQSFGYYLKDLGPFQSREVRSDPTVYMHLYSASHYRPVLLSRENFESLTRLDQDETRQVIERAARKAGLEPSVLAESVVRTPVGRVYFGVDVLLLPGPYSVCGSPK